MREAPAPERESRAITPRSSASAAPPRPARSQRSEVRIFLKGMCQYPGRIAHNSISSRRGAIWQRAWFGTRRVQVRILPPRHPRRVAQMDRAPHYECGGWRFDPSRADPRDVAQSGRAPGSDPGGRRFKSCRPDILFAIHFLRQKEKKTEITRDVAQPGESACSGCTRSQVQILSSRPQLLLLLLLLRKLRHDRDPRRKRSERRC